MMKTNACRLLDKLQISYDLRHYEVNLEDLSAESVAAKIGLPGEQVFKTLVVKGEPHDVCLALVPGDAELDRKAFAKLSGIHKPDLVSLKEVQPLTGYVRGAVTALASRKAYPVYIDDSASRYTLISVSAGVRGLQILLRPEDYVRATQATIGPLAKPKH